ncbi:MAG: sensor histidine kinase, partial [Spirochaetaceae bacterium]|nr:sensor histidine kinase [Spirochaetaceae bacterium]
IVTQNNVNQIQQIKQRTFSLMILIFLASSIVTALAAMLIGARISQPLSQLQKRMLQIEQGQWQLGSQTLHGQKEILRVGKSFDRMIREIRSLMDRLVEEQRSKRKTELVALQNQINPHFLYNTLDSIVWLAEQNRTNDVITTVFALARFFRISISRGKNLIPVRDEIAHVRNYLTIQQIRYQERFEYQFDVDKALSDFPVMKLILQPLVENAIYHGMGDEKERIDLRGFREDDFLYFQVENTGLGIDKQRIEEMYRRIRDPRNDAGVGLRNVYQRLKLYHGEASEILIESELDEYTRITLKIPFSPPGEDMI